MNLPTMTTTIARTIFFLTLAFLATFTTAQEGTILDPSRLPQCAFSCQLLVSAQQLCVPPVAPVQNQGAYQTCFCNSNYLINYKAGAVSPTCDEACTSDNERRDIQQWFVNLCSGGVVVIPQGNEPNPLATVTVPGVLPTTTGLSASTGGSSSSNVSGGGHKSWISGHYQWIILIIVLIFAAAGATFLLLWLKRRHDRKWATGGHARESMLQAQEIANSLSNRHPDGGPTSMGQVTMPNHAANAYLNGSREQLSESGTAGPSTKRPASARLSSLRQ